MRLTLFILFLAAPAWGQEVRRKYWDPYAKPQRPAIQVHDHLQVLVSERSRGSSATDLRTDRRSRVEVDIGDWIKLESQAGGLPKLRAAELADDPGLDLDARLRKDSTGRTSREFDLTFTITAEVVDVKPNGMLTIHAFKRRKVNGETEMIKLSGEVVPKMVGANNTIRSSDIANLDIEYDGEGTTGDSTKSGWLSWVLDKLWPF